MFGIIDKIKSLSWGKKESSEIVIYAPVDGEIVPIEDVPDVVFSEKVVGDGIGINPTNNRFVAPISGVISKIFETYHAYAILSKEGLEVFVHIGIDTIEFKGEGFTPFVKEGQKVEVGDTILEIDLELLSTKSKSMISPIVISNIDELIDISKKKGTVKAGTDIILVVTK